jgi:hypothetical protein
MVAIPVAVAILALMAAIIIPNFLKSRAAAAEHQARAELELKRAEVLKRSTASISNTRNAPASAEELRSRFEQGLRTASPAAIGALYNWNGVSERMKAFQLKPLESLASQPTNEMRVHVMLQPLPAGFETESVRNGVQHSPNVSLLGMVNGSLSYMDNGTNKSWGTQIPYGTQGEQFYLAGTIEKKVSAAKNAADRFELRWVAREDETNLPAEWLPDANDRNGEGKLRVLREVLLDGDSVESAGFAKFEPDRSEITVLLSDAGGRRFAELTGSNVGRRLAIVWNGRVVSAPVIRDAITTRQVMITGNFGYTESQLLVDVLNHRKR